MNLSKRITSESRLIEFGTNVLKLPDHEIQTALHDKKELQSSTHRLLTSWLHQQTDRHTAYSTLHTALQHAEMNLLATELAEWVSGEVVQSHPGLSHERKWFLFYSNINVNS